MSTDWPRTFSVPDFPNVKLPTPMDHTRAGYLDGMGIVGGSTKVLTLGRRVLLRERETQPGTLKYNLGHIGIRRLRIVDALPRMS